MNYKKMAQRVATRVVIAYEPDGDLERLIAYKLSRQFGITDAPEEVFVQAAEDFREKLVEEDMDEDLSDPEVYPFLIQSINAALEEEGLLD